MQREPSMDEILSTIRRMIVQDGGRPANGGAAAQAAQAQNAAAQGMNGARGPAAGPPVGGQAGGQPGAAGRGDEVLMLTEAAEEDEDVLVLSLPEEGGRGALPREAAREGGRDASRDGGREMSRDASYEFGEEPVMAPAAARQRGAERPTVYLRDESPIIGDQTDDLISAAISRFSSAASERKTLEDVAREALQPLFREWIDANLAVLLREWMDKNLPAIVERTVEKELMRISRSQKPR